MRTRQYSTYFEAAFQQTKDVLLSNNEATRPMSNTPNTTEIKEHTNPNVNWCRTNRNTGSLPPVEPTLTQLLKVLVRGARWYRRVVHKLDECLRWQKENKTACLFCVSKSPSFVFLNQIGESLSYLLQCGNCSEQLRQLVRHSRQSITVNSCTFLQQGTPRDTNLAPKPASSYGRPSVPICQITLQCSYDV